MKSKWTRYSLVAELTSISKHFFLPFCWWSSHCLWHFIRISSMVQRACFNSRQPSLPRSSDYYFYITFAPLWSDFSLFVRACDQLLFYYFHFAKADCCIHTASSQRRAARMKKNIYKTSASERSVHTKILANRHYMLDIKQRNTSSAVSPTWLCLGATENKRRVLARSNNVL